MTIHQKICLVCETTPYNQGTDLEHCSLILDSDIPVRCIHTHHTHTDTVMDTLNELVPWGENCVAFIHISFRYLTRLNVHLYIYHFY